MSRSKAAHIAVLLLVAVYLGCNVLIHSGKVRDIAARYLSVKTDEIFGGDLTFGSISIIRPLGINMEDVTIVTPEQDTLATMSSATFRMKFWPLLKNQIAITGIRLLNPTIKLERDSIAGIANYQYLIDVFSSDKSRGNNTMPVIKASSIIIRNGNLSYDVADQEHTPGVLNKSHIGLRNINANISLKALSADTVNMHIRSLRFKEQSGFELRDFKSRLLLSPSRNQIRNLSIRTSRSTLSADNILLEDGLKNITRNSSDISIQHFESRITPDDFAAILPQLSNFKDNILLTLSVSGKTDRVHIDNLRLRTSGSELSATANGTILHPAEMPDVRALSIRLSTDNRIYEWLSRNLNGTGLVLPDAVRNIGRTTISANADGNIRDNNISIDAVSDNIGTVVALLNTKDGHYNLDVSSQNLNIRSITGNNDFGYAAVNLTTDGVSLDKDKPLTGKAVLTIPFIEYRQHRYSDISVNTDIDSDSYNLLLNILDKDAGINASLTYHPTHKHTEARIGINNFDLYTTHIYTADSISRISSLITADITGTEVDQLRGFLSIDSLIYTNSNGPTQAGATLLKISETSDGETMVSLSNNVVNATVFGKYELTTVLQSFENVVSSTMPALYEYLASDNVHKASVPDNKFDAYVAVRENDIANRIFNIPLFINDLITLHICIDDVSNKNELSVDIPSAAYGNKSVSGLNIRMNGGKDTTSLSMTGKYVAENKEPVNLYGYINGSDDILNTIISWKGKDADINGGNVMADLTFGPYSRKDNNLRVCLDINQADINIKGTDWHTGKSSILSDNGMYVIDNFTIAHGNQYVKLDGTISDDSTHHVTLNVANVSLDDIPGLVDKKSGAPLLSGRASGLISASAVLDKPIVSGHINAGSMSFLGTRIDSLNAVAGWDNTMQRMELNVDILNSDTCHTIARGLYTPKSDSLDLYVLANHLDLYFLNSLIPKTTISEIKTFATANIRIYGKTKKPDFSGNAYIEDTYVNITPNEAGYYIPNAYMQISPKAFIFHDMDVYDYFGNYGIIDLEINHDYLKRFRVDLDMLSSGINVFNISPKESSSIQGRIFASGSPHLSTRPGLVTITGNCRTTPGTWLDVETGANNAENYNFLTIKDASIPLSDFYREKEEKEKAGKRKTRKSAINANLNVGLTDDAVIYAKMSSINGSIRGYGDLLFKYDSRNGINISGVYNTTRGNCTLSFQQILRKEFSILEGSRITFNGALQDAGLDIHACHTVNSVSMYDLDVKTNSSSRVKVNCLLDVRGNLSDPQISFGVEVPQASAEEIDLVASATSTEEQRNMQFMYLLTLGRFYTYDYSDAPGSTKPVSAMQSLLNNTINGQITNLLSQVINSNYVSLSSNLNGGYLSGDPTSFVDETFEGILEAHLLNNRLTLNGNFGYRKNNLYQTSSLIGDFELKYLLFPKAGISLLGYNRNNQRYYTKTTLNTQGVGVEYESDFDSFFKRKSSDTVTTVQPVQKADAVTDSKRKRGQDKH